LGTVNSDAPGFLFAGAGPARVRCNDSVGSGRGIKATVGSVTGQCPIAIDDLSSSYRYDTTETVNDNSVRNSVTGAEMCRYFSVAPERRVETSIGVVSG